MLKIDDENEQKQNIFYALKPLKELTIIMCR